MKVIIEKTKVGFESYISSMNGTSIEVSKLKKLVSCLDRYAENNLQHLEYNKEAHLVLQFEGNSFKVESLSIKSK